MVDFICMGKLGLQGAKTENYTMSDCDVIWLFNVTINDISVIYVTTHRCAGGLKKKLDLRSGSYAIDIS